MSPILSFLIQTLLLILSVFLILLVLVQRGRGGGLAGALGGGGGQSAFGTKAGDVFTKITIVTAAIWILLCAAAVKGYRPDTSAGLPFPVGPAGAVTSAPAATPSATEPASTPAVPPATPAATPTGTGS